VSPWVVKMPIATTTTLIGGSLGFCMQMYINALRKLPVLRSAFPDPLHPLSDPRARSVPTGYTDRDDPTPI
jgi:hypothetical protein